MNRKIVEIYSTNQYEDNEDTFFLMIRYLQQWISKGVSYHHPVVNIHFLNAAKNHVSHSITFYIYKFLLNEEKAKQS